MSKIEKYIKKPILLCCQILLHLSMQQSGLNKLTLYENKDFEIVYTEGKVQSISNTGDALEFDTENEPKLNQDLGNAFNNDILTAYEFLFLLYDFDTYAEDVISLLSSSIYGWIPVYEMNDNDKFLILKPFFAEVGELDTKVSHSWPVTMTPRIDVNNVDIKEFL